MDKITRRDWMKVLGLGGAAALLGGCAGKAGSDVGAGSGVSATGVAAAAGRKRVLRVAQVTDVHVRPELGAPDGLAACLRHVQGLKDRPSLIVNTGDCVMDSLGADAARTDVQWEVWRKVMRDECSLPIVHGLGNHDCWGWFKKKAKTTGAEPLYGKKRALEALGLARPYYSFDRAGWHFVMLDSTQPFDEQTYRAYCDEAQMDWLKGDLKASKGRPTVVMSHIPIISPAAMAYGSRTDEGKNVEVGGGSIHLDAAALHKMFREHGGVKLCLSGHLHMLDRAEFEGITYVTTGAVCSGWWRRKFRGVDAGYAVVDLFEGGAFDYQYLTYGWQEPAGAATQDGSAMSEELEDSRMLA
jgi:3',5'-cyclic AMP phosphodiesterase CpdA